MRTVTAVLSGAIFPQKHWLFGRRQFGHASSFLIFWFWWAEEGKEVGRMSVEKIYSRLKAPGGLGYATKKAFL